MQNTTVPLFESGMTETNGTGSFILEDLKDGTFEWTLDLEREFFIPSHHFFCFS